MTDPSWRWERRSGPAELLHDTTPPTSSEPTAWVLEIVRPTVVLGSAQTPDIIDHSAAEASGIVVAGRHSGGGAVLLVPGEHVWIDVWVPAGSRWWDDDVSRAADWLAEVWIDALRACGLEGLTAHRGAMVHSPWSRQVCFAGLGPGEVCAADAKLVGVSQRRTREWTRFQCIVHRRWDAASVFGLLRDDGASAAASEWQERVAVVGDADIETTFATALTVA